MIPVRLLPNAKCYSDVIVQDGAVGYCFCFCSSSSASTIISIWESTLTAGSNILGRVHAQLTHLPKLNFASRLARPDHGPQTRTANRGTWTTRVCPNCV